MHFKFKTSKHNLLLSQDGVLTTSKSFLLFTHLWKTKTEKEVNLSRVRMKTFVWHLLTNECATAAETDVNHPCCCSALYTPNGKTLISVFLCSTLWNRWKWESGRRNKSLPGINLQIGKKTTTFLQPPVETRVNQDLGVFIWFFR